MRRQLTRPLTAATLAVALALAGCNGDGADAPPDDVTTDPEETTDPGDEDPGDVGGATITIEGFAFGGPDQIAAGTEVTATNRDSAPHTWSSVDGAWDSGSLGEGDSFSFTFDDPGTYDYRCEIHPTMTGSLTVTG